MRKWLFVCAKGLVFATLLFLNTQVFAVERISDFSGQLELQGNGALQVREKIIYDFGDVQRHGIYRYIPTKYNNAAGSNFIKLRVLAVTDDAGNSYKYELNYSRDQLWIKIGDPKILITGAHTYIITYQVKRIVRFGNPQQFAWNIVGTGWTVPIEKTAFEISFPKGKIPGSGNECFSGTEGSLANNCHLEAQSPTHFTVSTGMLSPGKGLTVYFNFPENSFPPLNAADKRELFIEQHGFWGVPIFVALLCLVIWLIYGKGPKGKTIVVAQYEPPADLSPLYTGTLVDGRAQSRDIVGEIVQLARLGYVRINRLEKEHIFGFSSHDYELVIEKSAGAELNEVQKLLHEAFFTTRTSVKLSELKRDFAFGAKIQAIFRRTYKDLVKQKYFRFNPTYLHGIFSLGYIAGLVSAWFLGVLISPTQEMYLPFAVLLTLVPIILLHVFWSHWSTSGVSMRAYIKGLGEYISVAEKDRLEFHNAPEKTPAVFEKLLPFAIALGLEKKWGKAFEGIVTQPPTWYGGPVGSFSASDFSTSMGSSFSSAFASTGGGSGGGGGGSGGGGGGGGGGSW